MKHFCFIFLLIFQLNISAQPLLKNANWFSSETEDFATKTEFYSLIISTEGIIYVATNRGLYYFDGIHFVSLSQKEYLKLYEDKKQNIWALPYNGRLLKIEKLFNKTIITKEIFKHKEDSINAYNVFELSNDSLIFLSSVPSNNKYYSILVHNNNIIFGDNEDYYYKMYEKYFLKGLSNANTSHIVGSPLLVQFKSRISYS